MKVTRKMVSLIQDQEWKDVRSSITPAFTTGKIKRVSYHSQVDHVMVVFKDFFLNLSFRLFLN